MRGEKDFFAVGVTGHRRLSQDQMMKAAQAIRTFFAEIEETHGEKEILLLSSLAEGADCLCAKLGLEFEWRLLAVLPMNASEYRKDFSIHSKVAEEFDCLLSMADEVLVVLEDSEERLSAQPSRGFYYRQAGIYVVKHCDVLLAVWDGEKRETPDGAGTWETMKLAREFGKEIRAVRV